jgi:hypothetical protein
LLCVVYLSLAVADMVALEATLLVVLLVRIAATEPSTNIELLRVEFMMASQNIPLSFPDSAGTLDHQIYLKKKNLVEPSETVLMNIKTVFSGQKNLYRGAYIQVIHDKMLK